MKQNGQWLSQVCTRSKTACASSSPSGAPSALSHHELLLQAAPPDLEVDLGAVGVDLVGDHVAELLAVDGQDLVAGGDPGLVRRRPGRDGKNASGGHQPRIRGRYARSRCSSPLRPPKRLSPPMTDRVEQVLLAEPRGFCAGVEMAIKALAWMVRAFEPPVYCYHEIVHNRLVVERFREQGVIFVDDVDAVPAGAPLMLSAHGSAPEVVEAARAEGRYVVNAVCPLVTKVHHEARVRARKGFTILYVGHAGHDEAVGTLAVAPDAIRLVEHADDLDRVLAELVDDPTGRDARADDARARRVERHPRRDPRPRRRRVDRVAQRPLLRDHQPPGRAHRDRAAGRRGGRDRQRQLVEHARARARSRAMPAARSCCASTAPTSSTSTSSAAHESSASPPARARPKSSSTR